MSDQLAREARPLDGHAPAARDEARIPILLVTGFLGSGKTTLINRLLKTRRYARTAVVVNEFGEVSVDHMLIEAPKRRMRVVDGGCLCGHVHEEVATSLLDLASHRRAGGDAHFDHALIETSGLADPVPIIQVLLADSAVTEHFELQAVIAAVDGVHGGSHLDNHVEPLKQAAVADVIIITKADLAAPPQLDSIEARIAAINPGAQRIRAVRGDVDSSIFDKAGYAPAALSAQAAEWLNDADYASATPAASADPSIHTFTLTHEEPITAPGFVLWMHLLAGFRGAGLLRVKGIVNVEGEPYAVQAVQSIISEPVPLECWPDQHDRFSRLVFITRGMDEAAVKRTFGAFRFEGGRDARNLTIRPETYARFRETIQLFRQP